MRIQHVFPREYEGGKPLTQGDVQTLLASILGSVITYLSWIPDVLQYIILVGTATYVVFRAIREVMKFLHDYKHRKDSNIPESGDG